MSKLETRRILRGCVTFYGRRYFSWRLGVYNYAPVFVEKTDNADSILVYSENGQLICRANTGNGVRRLMGGEA